MKKITSILIAVSLLLTQSMSGVQAHFKDVPEDHPSADAIEYMEHTGAIKYTNEGMAYPDEVVTKAAFLKMLTLSTFSESALNSCLPSQDPRLEGLDREEWYAKYVCIAVLNDIANVSALHEPVAFGDAVRVLGLAFGLPVRSNEARFRGYVQMITELGALPPGVFDVLKPVTKAETAHLIYYVLLSRALVSDTVALKRFSNEGKLTTAQLDLNFLQTSPEFKYMNVYADLNQDGVIQDYLFGEDEVQHEWLIQDHYSSVYKGPSGFDVSLPDLSIDEKSNLSLHIVLSHKPSAEWGDAGDIRGLVNKELTLEKLTQIDVGSLFTADPEYLTGVPSGTLLAHQDSENSGVMISQNTNSSKGLGQNIVVPRGSIKNILVEYDNYLKKEFEKNKDDFNEDRAEQGKKEIDHYRQIDSEDTPALNFDLSYGQITVEDANGNKITVDRPLNVQQMGAEVLQTQEKNECAPTSLMYSFWWLNKNSRNKNLGTPTQIIQEIKELAGFTGTGIKPRDVLSVKQKYIEKSGLEIDAKELFVSETTRDFRGNVSVSQDPKLLEKVIQCIRDGAAVEVGLTFYAVDANGNKIRNPRTGGLGWAGHMIRVKGAETDIRTGDTSLTYHDPAIGIGSAKIRDGKEFEGYAEKMFNNKNLPPGAVKWVAEMNSAWKESLRPLSAEESIIGDLQPIYPFSAPKSDVAEKPVEVNLQVVDGIIVGGSETSAFYSDADHSLSDGEMITILQNMNEYLAAAQFAVRGQTIDDIGLKGYGIVTEDDAPLALTTHLAVQDSAEGAVIVGVPSEETKAEGTLSDEEFMNLILLQVMGTNADGTPIVSPIQMGDTPTPDLSKLDTFFDPFVAQFFEVEDGAIQEVQIEGTQGLQPVNESGAIFHLHTVQIVADIGGDGSQVFEVPVPYSTLTIDPVVSVEPTFTEPLTIQGSDLKVDVVVGEQAFQIPVASVNFTETDTTIDEAEITAIDKQIRPAALTLNDPFAALFAWCNAARASVIAECLSLTYEPTLVSESSAFDSPSISISETTPEAKKEETPKPKNEDTRRPDEVLEDRGQLAEFFANFLLHQTLVLSFQSEIKAPELTPESLVLDESGSRQRRCENECLGQIVEMCEACDPDGAITPGSCKPVDDEQSRFYLEQYCKEECRPVIDDLKPCIVLC